MSTVTNKLTCISCHQVNPHFLFKKNDISIFVCPECGLGIADIGNQQLEIEDIYADESYFSERLNSENSRLNRASEQFSVIQKYWPTPGKLLDVGSALGYFAFTAAQEGWQVQGVEVSEFASNYATTRFDLDICIGTLESCLPKLNPPFDIVSFLHVLEHLPDPRKTLELASSLIQPGGGLYIEVPDFGSRAAKNEGKDWHLMIPPEHIYYFSERSLRPLLSQLGYEVVSAQHISSTKLLSLAEKTPLGQKPIQFVRNRLKYFRWVRQTFISLERMFKSTDVIGILARKI